MRPARMDHAEAVVTLKDRLGTVVEVAPRKPVRTETVSEKERAVKTPSVRKPDKQVARDGDKVGSEKARPKPKATVVADKSAAKKDKAGAGTRPAVRKEAKATG